MLAHIGLMLTGSPQPADGKSALASQSATYLIERCPTCGYLGRIEPAAAGLVFHCDNPTCGDAFELAVDAIPEFSPVG